MLVLFLECVSTFFILLMYLYIIAWCLCIPSWITPASLFLLLRTMSSTPSPRIPEKFNPQWRFLWMSWTQTQTQIPQCLTVSKTNTPSSPTPVSVCVLSKRLLINYIARLTVFLFTVCRSRSLTLISPEGTWAWPGSLEQPEASGRWRRCVIFLCTLPTKQVTHILKPTPAMLPMSHSNLGSLSRFLN